MVLGKSTLNVAEYEEVGQDLISQRYDVRVSKDEKIDPDAYPAFVVDGPASRVTRLSVV